MIGSSCNLYKVCMVCGKTKWVKEFESKGNNKRRTYCKKCKPRKSKLYTSGFSQYKFDTQVLRETEIKVRIKLPTKKRIEYTVSYEEAVLMVNEGMAGIVHETLIHRLYDKQAFKKIILERDNYTCCYCGKYRDTVDHIKPRSQGGFSSFNNCICACRTCNRNKDNMRLEEYLFYIEQIDVSENIQDDRIVQQLQYLLQTLEYLHNRIRGKDTLEEDYTSQITDAITEVENVFNKIRIDLIEFNKT